MPPLSTLRAKTAANPNSVSNGGNNLAPVISPENLVQIPPPASLDLPVAMPQRGVFPPSNVMVSDRSASTRVFRNQNMRSSVFQNQAQPTATQIAAAISTPAAVASAVEILVNNQPTTSQKIINFINSATVQWQSGANGQISANAPSSGGDGLIHGEPTVAPGSWESDPAYIALRDDFVGFNTNNGVPVAPTIGQLGWAILNNPSNGLRKSAYYVAGNMGILQVSSASSTAGIGTSVILDPNDTAATATQGFPLAYVGGWQAEFVFRFPKFVSATVANPTNQVRFYIGFASSPTAPTSSSIFTPRPASFIGLRFDTDPNTWVLSSAANAAGGNTVYQGTFTGAVTNALIGQSFTVAGFVAHASNNGTFTCVANTTSSITLANAGGVSETQAATATGAAFSDTNYVFEATQNGNIGSNIQGQTASSGIAPDNNWHRFRMRSLVAGTILFSLDGGTEAALTIGVQTITAGSGSGQSLTFTQELHAGGLQTTELGQSNLTGASPCPGTPVVVAGASGGTLGSFNATWNAIEQQVVSHIYIDTSAIASNAGGSSTTGTATFWNAFAPFMMIMNDSTGSNTVKCVHVDFFSFVWNPGLSAAGGTPVATNPRFW